MNKSTPSVPLGIYQQYQIGSAAAPIPVQRLIVLIPDTDFTPAELEQHIWQLAFSTHSRVLLLGISPDSDNQLRLRRQLVSMAAAIRDDNVSVEIQVEVGKDWDETVEGLWQTGDLVIRLEQGRARVSFQSVNSPINIDPQIPIYTLSVLHSERRRIYSFLKQVIAWSGIFGIMAAFFWGQVQINQLPQNWGQTVLLILSVIVEITMLLIWNNVIT